MIIFSCKLRDEFIFLLFLPKGEFYRSYLRYIATATVPIPPCHVHSTHRATVFDAMIRQLIFCVKRYLFSNQLISTFPSTQFPLCLIYASVRVMTYLDSVFSTDMAPTMRCYTHVRQLIRYYWPFKGRMSHFQSFLTAFDYLYQQESFHIYNTYS